MRSKVSSTFVVIYFLNCIFCSNIYATAIFDFTYSLLTQNTPLYLGINPHNTPMHYFATVTWAQSPSNNTAQRHSIWLSKNSNQIIQVDDSLNVTSPNPNDPSWSRSIYIKLLPGENLYLGSHTESQNDGIYSVRFVKISPTETLDILEDSGTHYHKVFPRPYAITDFLNRTIFYSSHNELFSYQPNFYPSDNKFNDIQFATKLNLNGTATYVILDYHNEDIWMTRSVLINILPVNDQPTLDVSDINILEDSANTSEDWITNLSVGPENESHQTYYLFLENIDSNYFSKNPQIVNENINFTIAQDVNGSTSLSITMKDNGGNDHNGVDSITKIFNINIQEVNDQPSFSSGEDQIIFEDSKDHIIHNWATNISRGPNNEDHQNILFFAEVDPLNQQLFSAQPQISSDGKLQYSLKENEYGDASISVFIKDDGGTENGGIDQSPIQNFTIRIKPINDTPTFEVNNTHTSYEDSSKQTISNWATNISKGPQNENHQQISFHLHTNNPEIFNELPKISPDGILTYSPAPNLSGSATITAYLKDDGGTENGGIDQSPTQNFTINIHPINDAPNFNIKSVHNSFENSEKLTIPNWATNISKGPQNEDSQILSFHLHTNNPEFFSDQPKISPDGTLSYTPTPNISGSTTISVYLKDDGGTDHAGVDQSPTQSFTINIAFINQQPTFTLNGDLFIEDDTSEQIIQNFASNINKGDPYEDHQTLSFHLTTNESHLFEEHPHISSEGTLSFTPKNNSFGTAVITIYLKDDGGTDHGGVDQSPIQSFSITIDTLNDAPSFIKGKNHNCLEDSDLQSIENWATAIIPGDHNESNQSVTFHLIADNPTLFITHPHIDENGTLTYKAAPNANGTSSISIYLKDNGGTENGGIDQSPTQTFNITIEPVNDPPLFTKGQDQTTSEDSPLQTIHNWATGISSGPTDESPQRIDAHISNDNPTLFSKEPHLDSNGTLTYQVANDQFGSSEVSIFLSDNGGTENGGGNQSAIQTFTITVNSVNDRPSFTKGPDIQVLEDCGEKSYPSWATNFYSGASNEDSQILSFIVNVPNTEIFSEQPKVNQNGDLTFTPAKDVNGTFTVEVIAIDDGGNDHGGVDRSPPQYFKIFIQAVNDAPRFDADRIQIQEDQPHQVFENWLRIHQDPIDESNQNLSVSFSYTNDDIFINTPTLSESGDLEFSIKENVYGTSSLTVSIEDDGGTEHGGQTQTTKSIELKVNNVDDLPIIHDQFYNINENQSIDIDLTGVSIDLDPLTYIITEDPIYGTLSSNNNNQNVTYTPHTDQYGTDRFIYKVNDGTDSEPAHIRIAIADNVNTQAKPQDLAQYTLEDHELRFLLKSDDSATLSANLQESSYGQWTVAENLHLETLYNGSFYSVSDDPEITASQSNIRYRFEIRPDADGIILQHGPITLQMLDHKLLLQFLGVSETYSASSQNWNSVDYHSVDIFVEEHNYALNVDGEVVSSGNSTTTPSPFQSLKLGAPFGATPGFSGSLRNVEVITQASSNLSSGNLLFLSKDGSGLNEQGIYFQPHGHIDTGYPVLYTPYPNAFGVETLSYSLFDREESTGPSANIILDIESVNDIVEVEDLFYELGLLNTPLILKPRIFDVDDDPLTIILTSLPEHGDININGITMTYMPHQDFLGTDSFTYKVNDTIADSRVAQINITIHAQESGEQVLEFNDQAWFTALNESNRLGDSGSLGDAGFHLEVASGNYSGSQISYVESGGSALTVSESTPIDAHLQSLDSHYIYGSKFTLETRLRVKNFNDGLDLILDQDPLDEREVLHWHLDDEGHLNLNLNQGEVQVRSSTNMMQTDAYGWTYLRTTVDLSSANLASGIRIFNTAGNTVELESGGSMPYVFLESTYSPAQLMRRHSRFDLEVDFIRVVSGIEDMPEEPEFYRGEVYVDEGASVSILVPGEKTFQRVRYSKAQLDAMSPEEIEVQRLNTDLYDKHPDPIGVFHGVFEFSLALEADAFDGVLYVDIYMQKPGETWKKIAEVPSEKPQGDSKLWWVHHFWDSRSPQYEWDDLDAQPYLTEDDVFIKYVVR